MFYHISVSLAASKCVMKRDGSTQTSKSLHAVGGNEGLVNNSDFSDIQCYDYCFFYSTVVWFGLSKTSKVILKDYPFTGRPKVKIEQNGFLSNDNLVKRHDDIHPKLVRSKKKKVVIHNKVQIIAVNN